MNISSDIWYFETLSNALTKTSDSLKFLTFSYKDFNCELMIDLSPNFFVNYYKTKSLKFIKGAKFYN